MPKNAAWPKRDDAGIAEDEIEREREQDGRENLRAQREIVGKDEEAANRHQPWQRFDGAQPMAPREQRRLACGGMRAHQSSGVPEQAVRPPQEHTSVSA